MGRGRHYIGVSGLGYVVTLFSTLPFRTGTLIQLRCTASCLVCPCRIYLTSVLLSIYVTWIRPGSASWPLSLVPVPVPRCGRIASLRGQGQALLRERGERGRGTWKGRTAVLAVRRGRCPNEQRSSVPRPLSTAGWPNICLRWGSSDRSGGKGASAVPGEQEEIGRSEGGTHLTCASELLCSGLILKL